MPEPKETIVISVGGSLIVPDEIDTGFLTSLRTFILSQIDQGESFVVIAGGGRTARNYQHAAGDVTEVDEKDLDWLGIHSTRLNGHLLRTVFHDVAHPEIIKNPDDVLDIPRDAKLIVASGYRPGSSTDLRAVQIAKHRGAKRMINLSNIDYAYTDDPRDNPDAEKIEKTSWEDFRKILPDDWSPGLSSPFDPIAAKLAHELGIEVAIINGSNLEALENYIEKKEFVGTLIA